MERRGETTRPPGGPRLVRAAGGRRLRGKVTGTCFAMLMILGSPHSMATNPVGAVAISVGLGTLVGLGATFRWRSWTWRSARRGPYAADADRVRALAERYRWMLHAPVPADRASAEAAIAWLTREAGLEPLPCVWVRSPREAALATMALRMYAADFDPVHGRSWLRVAGARPSGVEPAGWIRLVGMLETTLGSVPAGDPSDDERRSTALIDPPDPTDGGRRLAQRACNGTDRTLLVPGPCIRPASCLDRLRPRGWRPR